MPVIEATRTECLVNTYKEGLFSAIAHDLILRVERFKIEVGQDHSIKARFDAGSLVVISPETLSANDKRSIKLSLEQDVLDVARYPEIIFVSSSVVPDGAGFQVKGRLTLCGSERAIEFEIRDENGKKSAEILLHQPDFGIRPFSAMLGTLKIKPDVKIHISVW